MVEDAKKLVGFLGKQQHSNLAHVHKTLKEPLAVPLGLQPVRPAGGMKRSI